MMFFLKREELFGFLIHLITNSFRTLGILDFEIEILCLEFEILNLEFEFPDFGIWNALFRI